MTIQRACHSCPAAIASIYPCCISAITGSTYRLYAFLVSTRALPMMPACSSGGARIRRIASLCNRMPHMPVTR
jgi:hypothetical protein